MARRSDRIELIRVTMLLLAFAMSSAGLHTVLAGLGWWWLGMLVGIVVLGTAAVVRRGFVRGGVAVLGRVVAPVAAATALGVGLVLGFASDTALLGVIPTTETIGRFQQLVHAGGYSIGVQTVPATADAGISFLYALGFGVLVLFADVVAFSLRLTALVGLPLVAVFLVPATVPDGVTELWWFVLAAASYLALLTVGRPRQAISATAIGALAIVIGLIGPGLLPTTALALTSSSLGPSVSTGVNPFIRLGDDLRRDARLPVLTYSTSSGDPYSLRLVTIDNFSGTDWGPDEPALKDGNTPARLPAPPGVADDIAVSREVGYVDVANFRSPWLPVPYPATRISGLSGTWLSQPRDLTIASNGSLARGERYTVYSLTIKPTPEQLQAAGTTVPPGLGSYLTLPANMPSIISTTANRVAAGANSNYEKALALQQFFRSGEFNYSEEAPVAAGYDGTGMAVIAKFLQAKSGYCIHFAAAMAVMARSLDIPSRIVVGFQPGTPNGTFASGRPSFDVSTDDLHAWPELYFDGVGWLPFEPTPSRGVIPDYANQLLPGVPVSVSTPVVPSDPASLAPEDGAVPLTSNSPTAAAWPATNAAWLTALGIVALLATLGCVPAGIRFARRRKRIAQIRRGNGSSRVAWREAVDTAADIGVFLSNQLTPLASVDRLARLPGMTEEGRAALQRIGAAYQREVYGPPKDAVVDLAELNARAEDVRKVVASLLNSGGRDSRMRARFWPSSLLPEYVSGRLA